MGLFALLSLLSASVMYAVYEAFDDDGDPMDRDIEVDDPAPIEPTPPEVSFDYDPGSDTITIDIGADETGSVAVMRYVDTQDDPDNFVAVHEARYYYVPEGVDLGTTDWETAANIPGQDQFAGDPFSYDLADMEQTLDLTLLGTVDLLGADPSGALPAPGSVSDDLPTLRVNGDSAYYYLEATTDGDELVTFLPEDYTITRGGVAEQVVTGDTTGTAGADWLSTATAGVRIDGGDGNATLWAEAGDVTVTGGDGADQLRVAEGGLAQGNDGDDRIISYDERQTFVEDIAGATISGGAGDDVITIYGDGNEVHGDVGNDTLRGGGASSFHGGPGDDTVSGTGLTLDGGPGNDFVGVGTGSTGTGGPGDDHMQVDSGGTADGGDGDDLFTVWNFQNAEEGGALLTLGAGSDTVDAQIRGAFNGAAPADYIRITDFVPGEDVLQIAPYDTGARITDVDLIEDASGGFTMVQVTIAKDTLAPGISVIRLDGVTGLELSDLVIAA